VARILEATKCGKKWILRQVGHMDSEVWQFQTVARTKYIPNCQTLAWQNVARNQQTPHVSKSIDIWTLFTSSLALAAWLLEFCDCRCKKWLLVIIIVTNYESLVYDYITTYLKDRKNMSSINKFAIYLIRDEIKVFSASSIS
jgi:hypothetical protein